MSTRPNLFILAIVVGSSGGRRPSLVVITRMPGAPAGGAANRAGVGELPPEVEAGQEAEDLAERRALVRPQAPCEIELGTRVQDDAGADAAAVGRREEENP